MRILVTGNAGFLLRNSIAAFRGHDIIQFDQSQYLDKGYYDIDLIIHFASPSDSYDFKDKIKMAVTMIDLTQVMVDIAGKNKCKLVFASSMAADILEDDYGIYKRAMEQYIQALTDNYLILKIPRVYGKDRTKGLMKKIKLGDVTDWNKTIEYIDINDFTNWFIENLSKTGIEYYSGKVQKNTIKEIKEKYCEF